MKHAIAAVILLLTLTARASISTPDSLANDTAAEDHIDVDLYLYSRYVWRGVGFGGSPTVQAQMAYTDGGLIAACYVAKSLNGNKVGFPNTSNLMLGYQYKDLSLTLDDYFFYDEDNLDRYTDWSDSTLHFIEARVRFDGTRCYTLLGYNVYGAEEINKDALYIEGGYKFPKHGLTVFAGGLTDKSDLNFMTRGGVTNIGLTKEKRLKWGPVVMATLIVNPSYEHIVDLPGVTRSFLTMVVGAYMRF